jgi:hypothetical protein
MKRTGRNKDQKSNLPPVGKLRSHSLAGPENHNPVIRDSSDGSGGRRDAIDQKAHYKPYTYKDYRNMKNETLKMGGLGANIGSEEWEKS